MKPNSSISKRRGKIVLSRNFLIDNPNEQELLELFSNFFPVACNNNHSHGFYHEVEFHGYSPHFIEIEQNDPCPEYRVVFISTDKGSEFLRMEPVDNP